MRACGVTPRARATADAGSPARRSARYASAAPGANDAAPLAAAAPFSTGQIACQGDSIDQAGENLERRTGRADGRPRLKFVLLEGAHEIARPQHTFVERPTLAPAGDRVGDVAAAATAAEPTPLQVGANAVRDAIFEQPHTGAPHLSELPSEEAVDGVS